MQILLLSKLHYLNKIDHKGNIKTWILLEFPGGGGGRFEGGTVGVGNDLGCVSSKRSHSNSIDQSICWF